MKLRRGFAAVIIGGGLLTAGGCGGDATDTVQVIAVPADHPSIQDA